MAEAAVVLICLALNALLSAFEMAFVSAPKPELRRLVRAGDLAAKKLLQLRESPERALSILQLGITLVGAVSAAVGGAGASDKLEPWLIRELALGEITAEVLSIVVIVIPLTYLSVVVGELVPKTLALRSSVRIALLGARWMAAADRALAPAVNVLERSTKFIVRSFFARAKPVPAPPQTTVEIDNLPSHHAQAVLNLAHIESKRIRDILVPWRNVNALKTTDSAADVSTLVFSSGHTRLPVLDPDGAVRGILHTKEFLAYRESGGTSWVSIVRPALKARGESSLLGILRMMQDKKSHMVVVTQGPELLGIVTLEDIMEEIVGDIFDEDDDSQVRKVFVSRARARQGRAQE